MSNILIITDQPLYVHNENNLIAGPTISVTTVFSGDIVDGKFDSLNKIRSMQYDSILLPQTIIPDSPNIKKVLDFIDELKEKDESIRVHIYDNKY